VVNGLLDLAGFLKWREDYEAAGIDAADAPPEELSTIARAAGALACSNARRAIDSARALAPNRDAIVSPLLRELSLPPPRFARLRLPLLGWSVAIGLRWLFRQLLRLGHVTPEEQERVRAAADWLVRLAAEHGEVVAVTHGAFRSLLGKELARRGWTSAMPRRRSSHWSAWSFAAPNL
jgi:broad specificity phosphatase PhoE